MLRKIKSFLFENKTDSQTIIKNTFWLILAEGVSKGSMFLITIFIARELGPKEFGILNFIISFISIFLVITEFGLTTIMIREVSKNYSKIKDYLINFTFLKVILGIITFILVWIVSQFIGKSDFYITIILIYCSYAIINNLGDFIRAFFRPSENMQYEALLKMINGFLMLIIVLNTLFIYGSLKSILCGYLIAGLLSLFISLFYVLKRLKINKLKLDKKLLIKSLKRGFYLMGGMLAVGMFNYIDQIMIGFFRNEIELGYYASAYKIVGIIILFSMLFVNVIIPKLTKVSRDILKLKKLLKNINIFIFLSSFCFILISYIFSDKIILLFYGKDYIKASYTYFILSISVLVILLNNIYGNLIIIYKKEKIYFLTVIISLLLNIILNYIYIPIYGINAAAIITILTELSAFIIFYIYIKLYIFFNFKN